MLLFRGFNFREFANIRKNYRSGPLKSPPVCVASSNELLTHTQPGMIKQLMLRNVYDHFFVVFLSLSPYRLSRNSVV